jgi:hypothetical protein
MPFVKVSDMDASYGLASPFYEAPPRKPLDGNQESLITALGHCGIGPQPQETAL